MFTKKQILKTVLGVTPALIGLIISINGLKAMEDKKEVVDNKVVIEQVVVKDEPKEEITTDKDVDIEPKEMVIISNTGLNVRKNADLNSEIIKVYPYAKTVKVSQEHGNWYKTEDGYINKDYVEELEIALEASMISNDDIEKYKRIHEDYKLDLSKSITGKSGLNINDIYTFTNKYPGLRGIEQAVIDAEYEYGVNGFMTIAVASLESGFGKSNIAKDKNNLYGMNAQDHNPYALAYTYKTKYESVMDFARVIKEQYTDKGLTTLENIQKKYCPTNPKWDDDIQSLMDKTYSIVIGARE